MTPRYGQFATGHEWLTGHHNGPCSDSMSQGNLISNILAFWRGESNVWCPNSDRGICVCHTAQSAEIPFEHPGSYQANYPRSVIFPVFQYHQNTSYVLKLSCDDTRDSKNLIGSFSQSDISLTAKLTWSFNRQPCFHPRGVWSLFPSGVSDGFVGPLGPTNSLAPGKFEWNFRYVKRILVIDAWGISCEIDLIWMSQDFTDDQSTLVQVMAWCRQATSHYLSQCWPRSLPPNGVTKPLWVNPPGDVNMCQRSCWKMSYSKWRL